MNGRWGLVFLFLSLVSLAPWASRNPDTLQKVIGEPGGAGSVIKSAGGALLCAAAVILLAKFLGLFKTR